MSRPLHDGGELVWWITEFGFSFQLQDDGTVIMGGKSYLEDERVRGLCIIHLTIILVKHGH